MDAIYDILTPAVEFIARYGIPLTMQLIPINEVTLLLAPNLWFPQEFHGTETFAHDLAYRSALVFAIVEPVAMFLTARFLNLQWLGMFMAVYGHVGCLVHWICCASLAGVEDALQKIPPEVEFERVLGRSPELYALHNGMLKGKMSGEKDLAVTPMVDDGVSEKGVGKDSLRTAADKMSLAEFIARSVAVIVAFHLGVSNALGTLWFQQSMAYPNHGPILCKDAFALINFWWCFIISASIYFRNRRQAHNSGRRTTKTTVLQGVKTLLLLHAVRLWGRLLLGIDWHVGLYPVGEESFLVKYG